MPNSNGDKKNIDQRLEALTMNLELLSHSVLEHDRQIGALTAGLANLKGMVQQLVEVSNEDANSIRTLARIAEAHDARIAKLEGGAQ